MTTRVNPESDRGGTVRHTISHSRPRRAVGPDGSWKRIFSPEGLLSDHKSIESETAEAVPYQGITEFLRRDFLVH